MKAIFKILTIAIVSTFLIAGSVMAVPLPAEYELINPDTVGIPTYTPGTDLGYFIWTDDEGRTSWHIRWSGEGPDSLFTGSIQLENNTFGVVSEFLFENHSNSPADYSYVLGNDVAGWIAIANVHHDGLDFTIENVAMPAFVGFDLFIDGQQALAASNTFIGNSSFKTNDADFKIAAPVPEPTTILLSGLGLLVMGAYLRRRRGKKA